jgi:ubiquinone/menaquinone biosynthesis C-methylase UbiE
MTTSRGYGELFSRGAREWTRFMEPQMRPFYDAVHDRLGLAAGVRLLDIGCGPGGSALLAQQRGASLAGLDASPGSIEIAHERIPDGDFRVGDMESLPWPDRSFDAVTGFNSFQFAGDPAIALGEARRVLEPEGRLGMVIWAPPERSQQYRIMRRIAELAPPLPAGTPGPFALSSTGHAESKLSEAGLRLIDEGEVSATFAFPDFEAACSAMTSASGGARAIRHSGLERTRQTVLEALEEFRLESGGYRFENRFRYLIAEPES